VSVPIHNQQGPTSLSNEQKQGLLESLKFEQIDARQLSIKTAHAKTCKWLLKNSQYLDWLDVSKLDEHHGFLWIKGKAGAGKSTLMKFALINTRKTMKDHITLSFFFNARGEDIEKSTIGTYRSLLLQLLEHIPMLQIVFDSLRHSILNADHCWTIESLQMLLEQAIRALGDHSVLCFIDALDECEEPQVRAMIQFLEHVGELVVENRIRFRVCFSSRHYPHITIRNGLELILEGQEGHTQDITNYIETELRIGKSKTAQHIRVELQEKASGIFMWVVLVVGILNKASDCGQVHTLRRKLQEIPGDLHDLFRDILIRDTHNKDGLVLCIQWVLFAKQPLSPEQLYHAILSGIDPDAVSEWDSEEITKDVVQRFILDSSKGLAEATTSRKPKVQFIHESVRDFLLKENGLSKIWPEFGSNFQGQSQERLKQCCLSHISIDVITHLNLSYSSTKIPKSQAAAMRNMAVQKYPFLEYAIHNVLYHADAAEGAGVDQTEFLESLPLPRWVVLDNLFEKHGIRRHTERVSRQYVLAEHNMVNLLRLLPLVDQCMKVEKERYGCPIFAAIATGSNDTSQLCLQSIIVGQPVTQNLRSAKKETPQHKPAKHAAKRDFVYSKRKGMLLCAAELGHDELLTFLVNTGDYDIHEKDLYGRTASWWAAKNGCEMAARSLLDAGAVSVDADIKGTFPLYVAAESGNKAVVQLLLDNGADVNAKRETFASALIVASAGGHKEVVTILLDEGADINAQSRDYGNALEVASVEGFKEIVTVLLDKGADVNLQGGRYSSPLGAASAGGHMEVVTILLDKGADLNAQGGFYGNALQAASAEGFKEIVTVLLDKGADVNLQGGRYGSPLGAASAGGHMEVVTILLDKGADLNAQGGRYGNALQAASTTRREDIVTLLLDKGAYVNTQGGDHGNALQAASATGFKDTVTLLLDRGADVNAQGGEYGNALQAALACGYQEIVIMLLERGADVNAQGGKHGNALQAASARGLKDVVTVLLDRGADVNAQGGEYGNALQVASARRYKDIVTVLLDRGADVNAQGGYYGNALQAASVGRSKEIVTMLLDKGTNVNAQGGHYGNALQAASAQGYKEVVTMLLDKGAEVDAQGGYFGTALQAASAEGRKDIIALLVKYGASRRPQ
jgi:ankyrin repeat protein